MQPSIHFSIVKSYGKDDTNMQKTSFVFISDLYYNTKEVISIANYLLAHYKGRYRIKAPYDISTNQFPRKLNGNFEDIDCYIDCQYGNKIFSFGHGTLQAYIPSLIRGHNIIKNIENNYSKDIIFDIEELNSEVLFKFKAKDDNKIIPLVYTCNWQVE